MYSCIYIADFSGPPNQHMLGIIHLVPTQNLLIREGGGGEGGVKKG